MCGIAVTAAQILYLLETGADESECHTESTIHRVAPKLDEGGLVRVVRY